MPEWYRKYRKYMRIKSERGKEKALALGYIVAQRTDDGGVYTRDGKTRIKFGTNTVVSGGIRVHMSLQDAINHGRRLGCGTGDVVVEIRGKFETDDMGIVTTRYVLAREIVYYF